MNNNRVRRFQRNGSESLREWRDRLSAVDRKNLAPDELVFLEKYIYLAENAMEILARYSPVAVSRVTGLE